MRCLIPTLFVCLAATPSAALADKPLVAVFDIEDRGSGLQGSTLGNLNDYIADRLAAGGGMRVVPRERLHGRLRARAAKKGTPPGKAKARQPCFTLACQRVVSKQLGAHKALATRLMKIGKWCVVTCTLQDLRRPGAREVATERGTCLPAGVMMLAEKVVAKLAPPRARAASSGAAAAGSTDGRTSSLAVVAMGSRGPMPATVLLDGRRVGRTPLLLSNVTPGAHLLKISSRGYKSITRTLKMRPGQQSRLVVKMVRRK